ncbi:MAG: hypothetical protein QXX65_04655 [Candidatus Woesearchaeota archaeon]
MALVNATAVLATPEGVQNITIIDSQRRTPAGPSQIVAQGGNITTLSIAIQHQTRGWQGFVGNLTANLTLEDASGERMFAWNITNISGEIYASRNGTIDWNLISVQNDCSVDEELTGKGSDRVSKTFKPSANTVNFSVGTIQFNSSTTCAAWPFVNNSRQTTTNLFENILLSRGTTPNGNQSIYVGILQDGVSGYDGNTYNFQLLVPVNRTSGFTTYYIYAEIE